MALSMPNCVYKAYAAFDPDGKCSLTINIGPVDDELENADIIVDLYRVANAGTVPGYDTYDWQMIEPFRSFFEEAEFTITPSIDGEGWRTVAGLAAQCALGTPEGTDVMAPESRDVFDDEDQQVWKNLPINKENGEELKPGLYLIVPHGQNLTEYVSSKSNLDGQESIVTIAQSRHYTYSFTPELISLPTKAGLNTAQSAGEWIYDAQVDLNLKYSKEIRVGNLKITKDLADYMQRERADGHKVTDPATFVFEVSVYESKDAFENLGKNANKIYHNFISIVFDPNGDYAIIDKNEGEYLSSSPGKKTAIINDLPIDSYAVVDEVYSGAIYTKDSIKTALIDINNDDNTVEVSFKNKYDEFHNGGGSVTNKFTYKAGESKWGWEQVTDSSQDGEVIQPPLDTDTKAEN